MIAGRLSWLAPAGILLMLSGCPEVDDDVRDDDTSDDDAGDDDTSDDDVGDDDDTTPDGPVCWTTLIANEQILVIELDPIDHGWKEIGRWGQYMAVLGTGKGFALRGDELVLSLINTPSNQWASIDLQGDGLHIGAITYENCLAANGGDIIARCDESLCVYPSFDELNSGSPTDTISIDASGHSFTSVNGLLYLAQGSSAPDIEVFDLSDASFVRTIEPETWSGWTDGIGVAGDSLYLVKDVAMDQVEFSRFDLDDGSLLDSWIYTNLPTQNVSVNGLKCWD